ncbi:unnamed protein product [Brassica oleracea var. botrytis]
MSISLSRRVYHNQCDHILWVLDLPFHQIYHRQIL